MNTHRFTRTTVGVATVGAFLSLMALVPLTSFAASCTFSRDIQMNVTGDDVKCLQQYLNANGFVIAAAGPGASGSETGEYKALTQAAVIRWQQANNITPAQGYFGPRSRAVYQSLISGGVVTPAKPVSTSSGAGTNNALVDELLAKIDLLQKQMDAKPGSVADNDSDEGEDEDEDEDEEAGESFDTRDLLREVLELLEEVEDGIDDSDDGEAVDQAESYRNEAEDDIFKGLRAYVESDYDEADDRFEDAFEWAEKALDEVGGSSERGETEDLLDEVEERIDEVEELIDEADADGERTSEAEDLLDEAIDLFDEAEEAYDDEDYDEALDLLDEVEDLLNDAEDAIGEDGSDTEDLLDEARDDLDDAWDDLNAAIDDGDDVGDAEDYLEEAEDLLNEAEDYLDDGDDNEAEDLIDEAIDLIDDALGEF